jgi:hypothetical protein
MEIKLKLPILFYPDEDAKLQDLGIESKYVETRFVVFYLIDRIEQYYRDGIEHTLIVSNGEEMVTPLKINEVENIIDNIIDNIQKIKQVSNYLQVNN